MHECHRKILRIIATEKSHYLHGFVGLVLQSTEGRVLNINTTDQFNCVSHFLKKNMIYFLYPVFAKIAPDLVNLEARLFIKLDLISQNT